MLYLVPTIAIVVHAPAIFNTPSTLSCAPLLLEHAVTIVMWATAFINAPSPLSCTPLLLPRHCHCHACYCFCQYAVIVVVHAATPSTCHCRHPVPFCLCQCAVTTAVHAGTPSTCRCHYCACSSCFQWHSSSRQLHMSHLISLAMSPFLCCLACPSSLRRHHYPVNTHCHAQRRHDLLLCAAAHSPWHVRIGQVLQITTFKNPYIHPQYKPYYLLQVQQLQIPPNNHCPQVSCKYPQMSLKYQWLIVA